VLDVREAFRVWELGSLGVYLPMRPPARRSFSVAGPPRLAGHLASSWKFFRKPARDMAQVIRVGNLLGSSGSAVASLFKESFESIDVDIACPEACIEHYAAYRARFHCGRNWSKNSELGNLFTPLANRSLVELDKFNFRSGAHGSQLFCDAVTILDSSLLGFPFESPGKALSEEVLGMSSRLGGVKLDPPELTVWGRSSEIVPTDSSTGTGYGVSNFIELFGDDLDRLIKEVDLAAYVGNEILSIASNERRGNNLSHGFRVSTACYTLARIVEITGAL